MAFDVEAATQAYLNTLDAAARARSDAYFEGGYLILIAGALVSCLIFWVLLHFGWASRLARWADRVTGNRPALSSLLFSVPYLLLVAVLTLPWTVYTDYVREHRYGLSNLSAGGWAGEWLTATIVSTVIVTLIIVGLLALVRRTGTAWWAWGSALSIAFLIFFVAIAPVAIAPLFNSYKPMAEGPVKAEILAMARANGVPADNVYVVDQSRQSNRISANVQGLGPTARISLNDNLLATKDAAGIRAVMGHELGHYVLNHIWKMIAVFALIIVALFAILNIMMPRLIERYGARWGILDGADPVTAPLGGIIVTLFFLAATPLTNTLTRTQEMEADVFGLNAARAPDGFARMAMKLSTYRKIEPGAVEEAVFFTHPSGRTRVETAMRWKAEHLGQPGIE